MDPLHFGEEAIVPENMDTRLIEGMVDETGRARFTGIVEDAEAKARQEKAREASKKRRGMRMAEDPGAIPQEARRSFFQDQGETTVDASLYDELYHPEEIIDPLEALACEEEYDFVIPGLVLGDMGLLVAPGGVGKSSLAMYYAVKVALGEGGLKRGGVIMIAAEDDKVSAMIRMRDALKTYPIDPSDEGQMDILKRNLVIWPGSGRMCDIMSHNDSNSNRLQWKIFNTVREHPWESKPRLIIIDTLRRVAPIVENSNDEMSAFVQVVEKIARITETAVLVLHHASKTTVINGNAGTQQAARGGSALVDNARFCSHLLPMTAEEAKEYKLTDKERKSLVKFTVSKCNRGPTPPTYYFQRLANGVLVPTHTVRFEFAPQAEYGSTLGFRWGERGPLDEDVRRIQKTRTCGSSEAPATRRPPKRDYSNVGGLIRNRPIGGKSPEACPETPREEKPAITPEKVAATEARPEPTPAASPASAAQPAKDAAPCQDLSILALPAGTEDPAIGLILQEKSE